LKNCSVAQNGRITDITDIMTRSFEENKIDVSHQHITCLENTARSRSSSHGIDTYRSLFLTLRGKLGQKKPIALCGNNKTA